MTNLYHKAKVIRLSRLMREGALGSAYWLVLGGVAATMSPAYGEGCTHRCRMPSNCSRL